MNIILVDDNEKFRSTLRIFIEQKLNHKVLAECSCGEEFIRTDLALIREADVILMDIMMKNIDGIMATELMIWSHANLKTIVVTMNIEKLNPIKLIGAGLKGAISKSNVFDSLEMALNMVNNGFWFMKEFNMDITKNMTLDKP